MSGSGHGLVVFSHGTGGSFASHHDTALALARAGFVVAAVTHTGDNWRDQSRATRLSDRPRAVRAVIDAMSSGWTGRAAIDPAMIGVFGFSSGGLTALVLIGGVPDLSSVRGYCDAHPPTFTCGLAAQAGEVGPDQPPGEWIADPRIKAAVVAAPALGFAFVPDGLKAVTVPVQLWRAEDDRILPSPDYAEAVRRALPRPPEYHVVPGADHFDFLAPCSDALASVAPAICRESGGFDRAAFHERFNREVVDFFRRSMSAGPH